jgi:hypothetical protein
VRCRSDVNLLPLTAGSGQSRDRMTGPWLHNHTQCRLARGLELLVPWLIAAIATCGLYFGRSVLECKMPKVAVSEGQLHACKVQGPSVEVGSKTETVKVPTVHVTAPAQKK